MENLTKQETESLNDLLGVLFECDDISKVNRELESFTSFVLECNHE